MNNKKHSASSIQQVVANVWRFIRNHKKLVIAALVLLFFWWLLFVPHGGNQPSTFSDDSEPKFPEVDVNGLTIKEACKQLRAKGWTIGYAEGGNGTEITEHSDCSDKKNKVEYMSYYGEKAYITYKAAAKPKKSANKPSFKIGSYVKRPIAAIAKEFNKTYDWSDDKQLSVTKDGYTLVFEDGGKENPSATNMKDLLIPTGKVTSATIDLKDDVGKCSNNSVFDMTDKVMSAAGLNPDNKGDRNDNITLGAGYASYLNYDGASNLELRISCKYEGGPWQAIVVVRDEVR